MLQAHKAQETQEKLKDLSTHYVNACASHSPEKKWQLIDPWGGGGAALAFS